MYELQQFGQDPRDRVMRACEALSQARGIILVDDADRENEGDLIFSAEKLTVDNVSQMIRDCSGIICLCLTPSKARELDLKMMVENNTSSYQTAFTISIEAKYGVTTGVSAHDRWMTITTAIKSESTSSDLNQPGHIFPLVASQNGVLERRGHTEGSVDLMKIAHLNPSAVLCELMNPDGTMKKRSELIEYAERYNYPLLTVQDIFEYRQAHE